jgi:hypothetical protein
MMMTTIDDDDDDDDDDESSFFNVSEAGSLGYEWAAQESVRTECCEQCSEQICSRCDAGD